MLIWERVKDLKGREALAVLADFLDELKDGYLQSHVYWGDHSTWPDQGPGEREWNAAEAIKNEVQQGLEHTCGTYACAWGWAKAIWPQAEKESIDTFFRITNYNADYIFGSRPQSGTAKQAAARIREVLAVQPR